MISRSGTCLFLDSSLQGVAAGVADLGATEFRSLRVHPDNGGSAAMLPLLVRDALNDAGVAQVDGVVASVGPGSFTGLRIGLAFAAGLTFGNSVDRRMLGLSSLSCVCQAGFGDQGSRVVVLPCTRTVGYFAWDDGRIEALDFEAPHESRLVEALWASLAGGIRVRLSGVWPMFESQAVVRGVSVTRVDRAELVRAAMTGMLHVAGKKGLAAFTDQPPLPLYLRMSTAEERVRAAAEAKQGVSS